MFTFIGDTVLDPFLGSGTTSLAAKNLERNSVGYEINEDFLSTIKNKLSIGQKKLFETEAELNIMKQSKIKNDFSEDLKRLPYIFKDPIKFDKKTDPKKLRFGSKIDGNGDEKRNKLYSIKKVLSPECLQLNNDLKIKLIGIKTKDNKKEEAVNFIEETTKGKKVFLKFDKEKHDENNNLLCYLYLQNKTFINAHLIKNNLAEVDTNIDYKYKNKFLDY